MLSKWYLLRVGRFRAEEKSLSLFGGLSDQEEKPFPQIQQEIEKALDHGYQKICLSWNFIYHSEKDRLFSLFLEKPQFFVLCIHKKSSAEFTKSFQAQIELKAQTGGFKPAKLNLPVVFQWILNWPLSKKRGFFSIFSKRIRMLELKRRIKKDLILNCLIDEDPFFFKELEKEGLSLVLTLLGYKKTDLRKASAQLKRKYPDLFASFPCSHKRHPDLWTPEDIYSFLSQDFYPPPPYDAYNLSIPRDLKLEPSLQPEFEFHRNPLPSQKNRSRFIKNPSALISETKKEPHLRDKQAFVKKRGSIKASVIIPVYGGFKELVLTLKHLHQQDLKGLNRRDFEVIVIDDGSPRPLSSQLKKIEFLREMNFKFLSFPRRQARAGSKDHRFRAGLARNLGAREALGEFLFFLDADILVPPSYISSGLKQLEKHPVIQHPRYHLIPSAPVQSQEIVKSRHCFVKGPSYWEDFYESSQDWNARPLPWKYISTNTLCLRAEAFKQAGAFRKNYTCYGFEDTDLGYRLYQAGFPFFLHKLNTYHLHRESEYLGRENLKQELLGLSALTFFHNTHSLKAYREFAHLIKKTDFSS